MLIEREKEEDQKKNCEGCNTNEIRLADVSKENTRNRVLGKLRTTVRFFKLETRI